MRSVGKLGEKKFSYWASEMGVTVNPSKEDETGWDFFIEIPDYLQQNYTLVKYPYPIKAFVQVKSRDSKKSRRISIKLSNWRHLVQNPHPTFIVVLEYLGKNEPQDAYLIHIGEELIKRFFNRRNKLNESDKLNEKEMSVSYGSNERLDKCDSHSLFKKIVEFVNPNYPKYAIKKNDLISKYGKEQIDIDFQIHFDIPDEYEGDVEEYLVDFALGIVEKIEFNRLEVKDEELSSKKMWDDLKSISISRESIGKTQFKLRTEDYSEQVMLELDTFLPSGVSHIVSKEKLKIMFKGDFFYYMNYINKPDSSLKIEFPDFDESFKLKKADKICRLVRFLTKAENLGEDIISETAITDIHKASGEFQILESLPPEILEIIETIRNALNISDFFNIKDDVEVTLNELYNLKTILGITNAVIPPSDTHNFELNGMWSEERLPKDKFTATPFSITFNLGGYHLYLGAILIGKPKEERTEGERIFYQTKVNKVNILRKNITKSEMPTEVKSDLKSQIERHIEDDEKLILIPISDEEN